MMIWVESFPHLHTALKNYIKIQKNITKKVLILKIDHIACLPIFWEVFQYEIFYMPYTYMEFLLICALFYIENLSRMLSTSKIHESCNWSFVP